MKTINKYIKTVFAVLLLSLVGCGDFLDVTPHDGTSDQNSLETIEDFDMLLGDPYINARVIMSDYYLLMPDVMSDNLTLCYAGRYSFREFFNFSFGSTTPGVSSLWSYLYNSIMSANEAIVRLEENNPFVGTEDEEMSKNLLAEALALRGYFHFQLVRTYGKDYKVASPTDLGVPYKLTPEVNLPSRNTVKEVYDEYIIPDLEKAKTLMTDSYHANINYRINKKSLGAILAQVYMTTGNYEEAAKNASLAIEEDGSDIISREDFESLWKVSMNNKEVLLRYPVLTSDAEIPGNNWGQGENTSAYKAEYVVSASFRELFLNNDIRTSTTIMNVQSGGTPYVVPWKWSGRTGQSAGKVDIPAIRVSGMYLLHAEAYYRIGQEGLALSDLNNLRRKRYQNFTDGQETGTALFNAIALERRLELAFEGDRFYELKRNSWDVVRDSRGDEANGGGVPPSVLHVPATSPYYLLPIPQAEIEANDNMVQNNYN
ncbi:MAG: RagB/SusD family nutrient uptake outer membrane protein [Odoribacter sp.]|nr:RagB/SusD family nutrient uptake outer membrane protein [Odoribacter sp.]